MSSIVLGPFFNRATSPKQYSGFAATGVNLEFAASDHSANLPIYERIKDYCATGPGNYFIPADLVSWRIIYRPFFSYQVDGVLLLPLDEILLSIFRSFKTPRTVRGLLTEFRDFLQRPEKCEANKWHGQKLLRADLAEAGLRIYDYFAYGRGQHISVKWVPPQDAEHEASPLGVTLGLFELRAQPDGEFSAGKWRQFRCEDHLGNHIRKELGKIMKESPITLLTREGLEIAKREFKWQPVHFMTPKELKSARLDFIKNHPDLWADHKNLAKALQEAKLYQRETDLGHIRRSIPKFLEQVQKPESQL